jgi:Periplasmic component of the Tol biopolymer transport system
MKKPLALLIGIILSIIMLSVIYPSDPGKAGLLDRFIKPKSQPTPTPVEADTTYRLDNVVRVDGMGKALIWSPDEKNLYYSKPAGNDGSEELWVSDLKESKKINSKFKFINIRNLKWSPDSNTLSFLSGEDDSGNKLYIYDFKSGTVKDITPTKTNDIGVTSYDWDSDSMEIVMSVDAASPMIEIYNMQSKKFRKLDMKLKVCSNVSFYLDKGIIFSDQDDNGVYKIYSAGRDGKNVNFVAEGGNFIISPDKYKLAIMSDENGLEVLQVFYIATKENKVILPVPAYNVYWLSNSSDLMYSMESDCTKDSVYGGNLYYVSKDMKSIKVTDVVYPIFVPSASGSRIAITSPSNLSAKDDNKGVFTGKLNR